MWRFLTRFFAPPNPISDNGGEFLQRCEAVLPDGSKAAPRVRGAQPKILIADEDSELTGCVAELLAEMSETKITQDGDDAIGLIHHWKPDLILTGMALNKRTGLAICIEVKSRPETALIPVILLIGLNEREALQDSWSAGADDYLFKPFHPTALVARVRSMLRSVQQRRKAQEQIERLNEALERRVIELAEANRELKSLAVQLEQARDQALEASRFKSVFLANMSHEIRTPINGVISMSDMLMRTELASEQSEIASIIRDSAGSLLDIINDILDFSKIEAGKLELEIVDFELCNIVEGTAELVAEQARHKRLSLMTFVEPEIPLFLRGDPGRLRQILLNLLSNAIKFTQLGEVLVQVTLDAKDEERCRVRFSVTDTGIGMVKEAVHKLFQPFTQADGSITRRYGGTGLGLSIAKLLVELLDGRIGVRSTENGGSTFWFSIPLERARNVPDVTSLQYSLKGVRALVVDSQLGTAAIMINYLQSQGVTAVHTDSGRRALEIMRAQAAAGKAFHVAFFEQQLLDSLGFILADTCRHDPLLRNTRLILCTSSDDTTLGEKALKAGFSAILIKPVKQSRLYDCIALLMDKCSDKVASATRAAIEERLVTTDEMKAIQNTGVILVAEDNPVNQKVAMLLLKELGFVGHVVANGREAVDAASRAQYSLILMDCQMPDMDGFEATGAIRRAETLTGKHIPIVAMTAHAMQGDREKCIAAGMDDYVSKPVTAAKLKGVLLRWFKVDPTDVRNVDKFSLNRVKTLPSKGANMPSFESTGEQQSQSASNNGQAEVINLQALKAACGDDGALELLTIFVDSTQDLFERMDSALVTRDGKRLKASAHEMKGACGSVGATVMAAISKNIETTALAEDWVSSGKLVRELKDNFATVRVFCEKVLDSGE